ncbi:uncharacterized protein LAESUDRAFT_725103 [Laetiporus sulphureus 93-53]|uniref:Uncharacterized protein n=1 Tax=Laetiporus sulphureus 93-53 TaxID=1314785 RepID=A0A165EJT4_9APHY|nr:uncharacterized protein LAESUDRAFT_725103 [Laetiporus sulphureus 93-53]KZT07200.1 hypothetical protein LAESUDRAFT_725103 [Laetiporus sulphureus 93-53]
MSPQSLRQINYITTSSYRLYSHNLNSAYESILTSSVTQDTVKCANVEANGGTCSWPTCGCAEPPKSK